MDANKNDKYKKKLVARAKINLGLDITGRLENGYHGVRMVMQTLAFGDEVRVAVNKGTAADRGDCISLECPGSGVPCDERNLAYRAAKLLVDEYELKDKIDIRIDKKIPVAAGLAGGSSDAAAVLVALNGLCGIGLSQQQLMDLGLAIGADVPFCILQGTALAEGVGEVLTPLPALPQIPVILVKPAIAVSTKWAYESWDSLAQPAHPDIDALVEAVCTSGNSNCSIKETAFTALLENTFEKLVFDKHPAVREIKKGLLALGARGALMSGSGPTVFGLFEDDVTLAHAAERMRESYPEAFVCETYTE